MARLLRAAKRRNTETRRYQFELCIDQLQMSVPVQSNMMVSWIRGPRTASTDLATGDEGKYRWATPLKMLSTLYVDPKTGDIESKKSRLVIKQSDRGGVLKRIGSIELDLSDIASKENGITVALGLDKCSDKLARIRIHAKAKWMKEISGSELFVSEMSMASCLGSEVELDDDSSSSLKDVHGLLSPINSAVSSMNFPSKQWMSQADSDINTMDEFSEKSELTSSKTRDFSKAPKSDENLLQQRVNEGNALCTLLEQKLDKSDSSKRCLDEQVDELTAKLQQSNIKHTTELRKLKQHHLNELEGLRQESKRQLEMTQHLQEQRIQELEEEICQLQEANLKVKTEDKTKSNDVIGAELKKAHKRIAELEQSINSAVHNSQKNTHDAEQNNNDDENIDELRQRVSALSIELSSKVKAYENADKRAEGLQRELDELRIEFTKEKNSDDAKFNAQELRNQLDLSSALNERLQRDIECLQASIHTENSGEHVKRLEQALDELQKNFDEVNAEVKVLRVTGVSASSTSLHDITGAESKTSTKMQTQEQREQIKTLQLKITEITQQKIELERVISTAPTAEERAERLQRFEKLERAIAVVREELDKRRFAGTDRNNENQLTDRSLVQRNEKLQQETKPMNSKHALAVNSRFQSNDENLSPNRFEELEEKLRESVSARADVECKLNEVKSECEIARKDVRVFEGKSKMATKQLEVERKWREGLQQQLESRGNEDGGGSNKTLENELNQIMTKLVEARARIDELEDTQNNADDDAVQVAQDQRDSARMQVEQLRAELQQCSGGNERVKQLTEQITQLKKEIGTKTKMIESLEKKLVETNSRSPNTSLSRDATSIESCSDQDEFAERHRRMQVSRDKFASDKEKHEADNSTEITEKKLRETLDALQEAQMAQQTAQKACEEQSKKMRVLEGKSKMDAKQLQVERKWREGLQQQLESGSSNISSKDINLEKELEQKKDELLLAQTRIDELEKTSNQDSDVATLSLELRSMRQEAAKARARINELEAAQPDYEEDAVQVAQDQRDSARMQVEQLRAELQQQTGDNERVKELTEQLTRLKIDIATKTKMIDSLRKKLVETNSRSPNTSLSRDATSIESCSDQDEFAERHRRMQVSRDKFASDKEKHEADNSNEIAEKKLRETLDALQEAQMAQQTAQKACEEQSKKMRVLEGKSKMDAKQLQVERQWREGLQQQLDDSTGNGGDDKHVQQLNMELESIRCQYEKAELNISDLNRRNEDSIRAQQALQIELGEARREATDSLQSLNQISNKNNSDEDIEAIENDLKEAQCRVSKLEESLAQSESQRQNASLVIETQQVQVKELKKAIEEAQKSATNSSDNALAAKQLGVERRWREGLQSQLDELQKSGNFGADNDAMISELRNDLKQSRSQEKEVRAELERTVTMNKQNMDGVLQQQTSPNTTTSVGSEWKSRAIDAEEMLDITKQSFLQSSKIMQDHVESIENELLSSQQKLVAATALASNLRDEVSELKARVVKLKADRNSLSEYMSRIELELANNKMNYVNAIDTMNTMEQEKQEMYERLRKYESTPTASLP